MSFLYSFLNFFRPQFINGSDKGELLFGGFASDFIFGNGGNDKIFGGFGNDFLFGGHGNDKIFGGYGNDLMFGGKGNDEIFGGYGNDLAFGGTGNDKIFGGHGNDNLNGGDGEDTLRGGKGYDRLVGNKGNDRMFGGAGDDLLVWNNGDGSDLMNGGSGYDRVQVNFNTDLVNDDLQNKDVAEFSVTPEGVQFARVELNDQAVNGLFQLDIRDTEALETNFGGGDDTAQIVDTVLDEIELDLDGGDGTDTLDLSRASDGVDVDLSAGTLGDSSTATNFENVIGTDFNDVISGDDQDNVIQSGSGLDILTGGAGADTFVFTEDDTGVKVITDFEIGVDSLLFVTDAGFTADDLVDQLTQIGDDVQLDVSGKLVTFENASVEDFSADAFLYA